MIRLKHIISEQSGQENEMLPNILFIGDFEIKDRNSFAKRLIATRKLTGEIKFSQDGNTDRLLEILQSNLADNFDAVVLFSSGQFESEQYNETIENLSIAIELCHKREIPIVLFTFPSYTFVKDEKELKKYEKIQNTIQEANEYILNSNADFIIDLQFDQNKTKTFLNTTGTKISNDGHNLIVKKLIPFLKKLRIDIDIIDVPEEKTISGMALTKLQAMLIKLGYKIDKKEIRKNTYGESTQEAVTNFQLKNGLLPTGEIDLKTIKKLKSSDAIPFIGAIASVSGMKQISKNLDYKEKNIVRRRRMSGNIDVNKQVFLDAIAFAEGTEQYPNNGYYTLFTGKQFDSLDKHPNIAICAPIKGKQTCSTAAGRYGFLYSTWAGLNFSDFSEDSQDQAVFEIISNTTLQAIEEGDWETVFTSSNNIWASFPGDVYGQGGKSMDQMLDFVEKRIQELGGEVETTDEEGNIIDDMGNVISTAVVGAVGAAAVAAINYSHKLEYNPSSGFRSAARPNHDGVDYHASKGTPVVMAQSGKVIKTHSGCDDIHDKNGNPVDSRCGGGWGNHVRIKFEDGALCTFAHFTTVNVSEGDIVKPGTVIGTVGDTGKSYGAHLHFEYHPVGTYKAAGTPDIAEKYFGFGHGGTEQEYVSPSVSVSPTSVSKSDTSKKPAGKSIAIGDSYTPHVVWGAGGVLKEYSPLSKGGKGTIWLADQVARAERDSSVKNIVISMGTNDLFDLKYAAIDRLVINLMNKFPNAKLFVVQGSYGPNLKAYPKLQIVKQKQVDTYYNEFKELGVTVITPAVGNQDGHGHLPVYKQIANNIIGKLKQ